MLYGYGQDPLSCLASGGIPTPDGRCIPRTSDPRQAACEVQSAGHRWDPISQVCVPPGLTQPAQIGIAEIAARLGCAAMGGQWLMASNECQTADRKYGINAFQTVALPPGNCPAGQMQTPEGCRPTPPNGTVPPTVEPPATQPEPMPAWLLPTVIGIGAVALIAVVVSVQE